MTINPEISNELKEIMEDDFDELISFFVSDGQAQINNLKKVADTSFEGADELLEEIINDFNETKKY